MKLREAGAKTGGKMLEWKKLTTYLVGVAILAVLGFFVDFQLFKQRVEAVERRVEKIDEIKELQCEVAIAIFQGKDENKTVLRHCSK